MNINSIYRHPAELDAEAALSRENSYPESFSISERTAERMNRARTGLVHVMTELLPGLNDEQGIVLNCWLSKILTIIDIARIDAEGKQ